MAERVWIVDDNQLLLRLMGDILERNGYEVRTFDHPATVINTLMNLKFTEEKPPHVMIVDYWMPDLRGTQLVEEIRKMSDVRDISFVGITSRDEPEADAEFTKLGIYLLRKPIIHESDMLIRVMRAIAERSPDDATGAWKLLK